FALQNVPMGGLAVPALQMAPLPMTSGTSRFDLSLHMVERGGRLLGALEYSTDLFERETVERLVGRYVGLLAGVAGGREAGTGEGGGGGGGGDVGLDREAPRSRQEGLVVETGMELVLVDGGGEEALEGLGARVVRMAEEVVSGESEENPGVWVGGENVACLYYTSGSTGAPKGAVTTHRSMVRTFGGGGYVEWGAGRRTEALGGGEAGAGGDGRGGLEELRETELVNGYGPVESNVFASTHRVRELGEGARSVPIGRPIGNTQVYVVDGEQRLAPVGAVGEL